VNGSLHCRTKILDLDSPAVMGILNVTPDSFSDGGQFNDTGSALERIGEMIEEGAAIIDVGGESTRPGSDPVSLETEIDRTIPVLKKAVAEFPETLFSIDTTKFEVAEKALDAGVHIINDVSGLSKEPRFIGLCRETGAAYICMHSQGNPKTMQKNPEYGNVVDEISGFFKKRLSQLKAESVNNVVLDPGIGFGKTLDHNLEIIAELHQFTTLQCPVLVGASRKSMIGQLLDGRPADDRLAGTLAVHYHCLINGASILRVHDVKEAADTVKIFKALKKQSNKS